MCIFHFDCLRYAVFLTVTMICINGSEEKMLTASAQNATEGTNLTITCASLHAAEYFKFIYNNAGNITNYYARCSSRFSNDLENISRFHPECFDNGTVSTLTISNVTKEYHATHWSCQVYSESYNPVSNTLQLNVLVPPRMPEISNAIGETDVPVVWGYQNRTLTLECVARDGYPKQNVTFYKHNMTGEALKSHEHVREQYGLYTVTSSYTFTASEKDNGTLYVCESSYVTDRFVSVYTTALLQVEIELQTPLISNTSLITNRGLVVWGLLGYNLTLECVSVDGYPQPTVYWYTDKANATPLPSDCFVTEDNGLYSVWSRYTFTPTKDDDQSIFTCQASSTTNLLLKSQVKVQILLEGEVSETSHQRCHEVSVFGAAGGTIGGVAFVLVMVILAIWRYKAKHNKDTAQDPREATIGQEVSIDTASRLADTSEHEDHDYYETIENTAEWSNTTTDAERQEFHSGTDTYSYVIDQVIQSQTSVADIRGSELYTDIIQTADHHEYMDLEDNLRDSIETTEENVDIKIDNYDDASVKLEHEYLDLENDMRVSVNRNNLDLACNHFEDSHEINGPEATEHFYFQLEPILEGGAVLLNE